LYRAAVVRNLTTLLANPPTTTTYAEHRSLIQTWALEGKKLMFVAHSQGNLFAVAAHAFATTLVPASAVKVVHIAPASPDLRGPHTLADLDLVINALRIAGGTVPPVTHLIPGYLLRPPGLSGDKDALGHGLLEIYLNPAIATSSVIKEQITSAIASLVAPPTQAVTGFFTATLTWDGSGDVDLHTFEPGGGHVFYRTPQGAAGFLDVDNTVANGPEHYFASCDPQRLLPGTYQIAVANFSGATGRTATVQIASASDGVLGTRSITLGAETRDTPSPALFSVVVTKDPQTNLFSAALAP
jgi:hypothetical protein